MEREAKFPVPDPEKWQSISQVKKVAGFDQIPLGRERQRNIYFDTEDGMLARLSFASRVRETGDRRTVTVKGPAKKVKDVLVRYEEERTVGPEMLEGGEALASLTLDMLPEEIRSEIGELRSLGPILVSTTDRRNFALEKDGRRVCELSLDEVSFEVEGRELPVYRELEIELKGGTEGEQARLVRWYREEWELQPSERSKLEVGLKLAGREWPPPAQ